MEAGLITGATFADLRRIAQSYMFDTCVRLAYTEGHDADRQETEDWLPAETSVCTYKPAGTREAGTSVVTDQDKVYVPLAFGALLSSRDRLQVTTQGGSVIERSIDGDPLTGQSSTVVTLMGAST